MKRTLRFVAASLTAATFLCSATLAQATPEVPKAWQQQLDTEQHKLDKLDADLHKIMTALKNSTREMRRRAQTMSDAERKVSQKNLIQFHEDLKKAQALHVEIEDHRKLYHAAQAKKDYSKMRSVLELLVEKKTEMLAALQSAHGELEVEMQRLKKLQPTPPSKPSQHL
jgi:Zn-dependent M32 family carboxypeptidase